MGQLATHGAGPIPSLGLENQGGHYEQRGGEVSQTRGDRKTRPGFSKRMSAFEKERAEFLKGKEGPPVRDAELGPATRSLPSRSCLARWRDKHTVCRGQ